MTPTDEKTELERRLEAERVQRAAEAEHEPDDDDRRVEAERVQAESDREAEPELEAEPEPDVSDARRAKQLGRIVDGFEGELRELFGEVEPLSPVPMEGAIGFMVPGMLEHKTNEKYRRCMICNGHGQVLTGSLADTKQTADCPRCGGRGYLELLENPGAEPAAVTNGAATADDDAAYGVPAWMGNPNIGATA